MYRLFLKRDSWSFLLIHVLSSCLIVQWKLTWGRGSNSDFSIAYYTHLLTLYHHVSSFAKSQSRHRSSQRHLWLHINCMLGRRFFTSDYWELSKGISRRVICCFHRSMAARWCLQYTRGCPSRRSSHYGKVCCQKYENITDLICRSYWLSTTHWPTSYY